MKRDERSISNFFNFVWVIWERFIQPFNWLHYGVKTFEFISAKKQLFYLNVACFLFLSLTFLDISIIILNLYAAVIMHVVVLVIYVLKSTYSQMRKRRWIKGPHLKTRIIKIVDNKVFLFCQQSISKIWVCYNVRGITFLYEKLFFH